MDTGSVKSFTRIQMITARLNQAYIKVVACL